MDKEIRKTIRSIMDGADDMTIATIRPDGFPQATTVNFVNEGLTIYFSSDSDSQKTQNIAACNKVSLTINLPYLDWTQICGLSMAATAERLSVLEEKERVGKLILAKFPQAAQYSPESMDDVALFRVEPEVISVLDYSIEFGHTDEVSV